MATIIEKTDVYSGPGSNFQKSGCVGEGESVTVMWVEKSPYQPGNWYYIQYNMDGTNLYKRGYIREGYTLESPGVDMKTLLLSPRYVKPTTADTFYYPSSNPALKAGSVDHGEEVYYLGVKENNFAFIQYDVTGTTLKKRAYIYAMNLKT